MSRHTPAIAAFVFFCLVGGHVVNEVSGEDSKQLTNNTNSVLKEFKGKLKFSCSSFYSSSWSVEKAFDGKPMTSWFTKGGDAAAHGKTPWIAVEFPMAVTVRRVTLLSNREPSYPTGYTILSGRLELLNKEGKVIFSQKDQLSSKRQDMDFRIRMIIRGVYKIRFTSLKDEGDKNSSRDVALGEILIE